MQNKVEFIRNGDANQGNLGIGWSDTLIRVNGHELRCWHVVGSPDVLTICTADFLTGFHRFPETGSLTPETLVEWAKQSAELTARLPDILAAQATRYAEKQAERAAVEAREEAKRDADRRVGLITYVRLTRSTTDVVELAGQHYEVGPYLAVYTNGRCIAQGGANTRAGANRKVRQQVRTLVANGYRQERLVRTPYAG